MFRQTLCITPGDPQGIGPEIAVKFLHTHLHRYPEQRFEIIGSRPALEQAATRLNLSLPQTPQVRYTNISGKLPGEIAYLAVERAVEEIASKRADALVTGPIAKSHLKEAGILTSGHTELLQVLARRFYPGTKPHAEMLFLYRNFRMLLLTRHIPLSQVSSELMSRNFYPTFTSLCQFLTRQLGIKTPRISLLGVNPHAGEVGGVEETLVFTPIIDQIQQSGMAQIEGPFAADAFFRGFELNRFSYDAVVAAYHDQGLIPFKLIAGYKAVNVTIGLPFIRTSVGHGTAFDIAGQGIATEDGLVEAVNTAIDLIAKQAKQPLTDPSYLS